MNNNNTLLREMCRQQPALQAVMTNVKDIADHIKAAAQHRRMIIYRAINIALIIFVFVASNAILRWLMPTALLISHVPLSLAFSIVLTLLAALLINADTYWQWEADEIIPTLTKKGLTKDLNDVKQDVTQISKAYHYSYTVVNGKQKYMVYTAMADATAITAKHTLATSPDMIIVGADNHVINTLVLSNSHDIAVTQAKTDSKALLLNAIADYLNN